MKKFDTAGIKYITYDDLTTIIYGAAFLASGGGGGLIDALNLQKELVSKNAKMKIIDLIDLEDEKSCAMIQGMGAPAKLAEGYGKTAFTNVFNDIKKNKKYQKYQNRELKYLIPIEIGAVSILVPFLISSKDETIAVINGDTCGRAVPKLSMTSLNINNDFSISPIILSSDNLENNTHETKEIDGDVSPDVAEYWARDILDKKEWNDVAGLACYQAKSEEFRDRALFIHDTVKLAFDIGTQIQSKSYNGVLSELDTNHITYKILAQGKITEYKPNSSQGGFDCARLVITSSNPPYDKIYIYILNESLLAYNFSQKKVIAMAPDSINYIYSIDGQTITNAEIAEARYDTNKEITIIGTLTRNEMQNNKVYSLFIDTINLVLDQFPNDKIKKISKYTPLTKL